jgi:hypothetical protein
MYIYAYILIILVLCFIKMKIPIFQLNELVNLYNLLNHIKNDPEYVQWLYFSELKTQIDIAYSQLELDNDANPIMKQEINTNWLMLINKIDAHESECKRNLLFIKQLLNHDNKLDLIEIKLRVYKNCNQDDECLTQFNILKQEILSEINRMENCLFMNKSFVFINTDQEKTVAGKLLFITNAYLNPKSIKSYKKR